VGISQIRYNQALTRYNIGSDSGLEFKQSKIYLNSDSSKLMLQQENLKNAYIELYNLMNLPLSSTCVIYDTIATDRSLSLDYLINSAMNKNTEILSLLHGEKIAKLDLQIAKSQRYPTLDLIASYNYNFSKSPLFPSRFNESNGHNVGLLLSIPIFNGGEINRRVKNATLSQDNSTLLIDKSIQDLQSEIMQLYNMYNHNLRLIDFEEESRQSAFMNLDAAMEKYRLGSLSGIEFRDYQLSYLDASDRKLRALYQAKVLELTLRLLAGDLF
jgi:outer membrane protein TolC